MAKKSSKINLIYLIGMVVAAVGFCLPMFSASAFGFKASKNGFSFITFDHLGDGKIEWVVLAAILLLSGIAAGIVFSLVNIKPASLIRLIAVLVIVTAFLIIWLTFNDNWLAKTIGKGFWKHATYGTYMILGGWIVSLVGWITGR
ncbi:MAG: hypothetical protein K5829_05070 [Treponema sp.]|nr:hypothetical protein [Treponema sp.]